MLKVEKLKDKVEIEVSAQKLPDCSHQSAHFGIYYPCYGDCVVNGKRGPYGSSEY